MRSPWREPRRSAGRRARPASRCVAQATVSVARFRARGAGPWQHAPVPRGPNKTCASRRSASLFMCRKRVYFVRAGGQSSGTKCCENEVACVIARSASGEAIQGGQGAQAAVWIAAQRSQASDANAPRVRSSFVRLATRNGVARRTMRRQDGGGAGDESASKGLAQEITIPTAGACWRARGFCKRSAPCRR